MIRRTIFVLLILSLPALANDQEVPYKVILRNGKVITARSKPIQVKDDYGSSFTFTDLNNKPYKLHFTIIDLDSTNEANKVPLVENDRPAKKPPSINQPTQQAQGSEPTETVESAKNKNPKQRNWQMGTLLDTDRQSFTTYGGSRTTGRVDDYGNIEATSTQSSWNHDYYSFSIDGGKYIYVVSHVLSWRWSKEAKYSGS
jgi:hypothetical protein